MELPRLRWALLGEVLPSGAEPLRASQYEGRGEGNMHTAPGFSTAQPAP